MRKMSFLFAAVSLLLVACNDEPKEKVLKENEYQVKEIRFEKEKGFWNGGSYVYIDTEQETYVSSPDDVNFVKRKEPGTTILVKLLDHETYGEITETTIYVNQSEVSEISKKYAAEFKETLEFVDGKEK